MERFFYWLRSFIVLYSVSEAKSMNLTYDFNINDNANKIGFKSVWKDKYGNIYFCKESN